MSRNDAVHELNLASREMKARGYDVAANDPVRIRWETARANLRNVGANPNAYFLRSLSKRDSWGG